MSDTDGTRAGRGFMGFLSLVPCVEQDGPRRNARRLDRAYTVWGTAGVGLDAIRARAVGEPPPAPDRMIRVRVAADLPAAEQPKVEVMDAKSPAFAGLVAAARQAKGADFSICDVAVPARLR